MSDSTTPRQRVGRYEIVGHLASGGMAEIQLARIIGPSGFERVVVVKQILPHLARLDRFVDMFLDEARIIAGIRHQNVVHVHELGRQDGELFLVMEYLEGEGASSLIRRMGRLKHRLDPAVCCYLVAEACAGLHAAHESTDAQGNKQNLVHRDISPQNIFVTYDGEVKVLDFGIATAADRITKTEAGQLKGKYEYMSPEQCSGRSLDRRSDIFSLGSVLYELSTFRRPFRRANSLLTFKAICEENVRPPSAAVQDYPPELERICLKALSRLPENRYATAADMRRDLMHAAQQLGISHTPDEQVSRLMHRVFADRIDEKAEMLRRVRAGSFLSHVPAAEVDVALEFETQTDLGDLPTATEPEPATQPSRSPARWLFAAALLTVASIAAAWWLVPRAHSAADETQPAVEPEVAVASATPAPPASVTVHITSTPAGAEVLLDGTHRGEAPMSIALARGEEPVTIRLRKTGYLPTTEQVVPDVDQRLRVTLSASVTPPRRPPPRTTEAKTTPANSVGPSFFRYD